MVCEAHREYSGCPSFLYTGYTFWGSKPEISPNSVFVKGDCNSLYKISELKDTIYFEKHKIHSLFIEHSLIIEKH